MQEVRGNILSTEILKQADAICFTSNGVVRANGALVMGAGVAKAFRDRFPATDIAAGAAVKNNGNICQEVSVHYNELYDDVTIVAFPTKHHWKNPSDPLLITESTKQLVDLADEHGWKKVYLPRPGCHNGKLNWKVIKQILEPNLDDRFYIITL